MFTCEEGQGPVRGEEEDWNTQWKAGEGEQVGQVAGERVGKCVNGVFQCLSVYHSTGKAVSTWNRGFDMAGVSKPSAHGVEPPVP